MSTDKDTVLNIGYNSNSIKCYLCGTTKVHKPYQTQRNIQLDAVVKIVDVPPTIQSTVERKRRHRNISKKTVIMMGITVIISYSESVL